MKELFLPEVTPLSLGLETRGGLMTALIQRRTVLPARKALVFSTSEDNQSAVDVHVLQGERPMAADNLSLGWFRLEGIPPAPRGVPQVEVTFDLNARGLLTLSIRDQAGERELRVTIPALAGLNCCTIESMMRDARQHRADDNRRKTLAEARNSAADAIYAAEKTNHPALYELVGELRRAAGEDDAPRILALTETLQSTVEHLKKD